MKIRIEYEDADYAAMAPRVSKDDVKHLFHLSGTTEIIEFFGLKDYPQSQNLNRLVNALSTCLFLVQDSK